MPNHPHNTQHSGSAQDEALAVARATQKPGQTREQTRLIAQGIAKGIEQYKRQQSAKARERDKARKRYQKIQSQSREATDDPHQPDHEPSAHAGSNAVPVLMINGILMSVMSMIHLGHLIADWKIMINSQPIPKWVSLPAVLLFGALGVWSFRMAYRPS